MSFKFKKCAEKGCDSEFKQYNSLTKYCSPICASKNKKESINKKPFKAVKKVSDKRKIENAKYTVMRIQFLGKPQNSICFIDGCNKKANTIEHICGRKGFYDEWAIDNNISLYLDTRFWRACCLEHNLELENNPELSKKYQLNKITGKPKI
jgi:hypothetical protein